MNFNTKIVKAQTTYVTSAYPEGSFYFASEILAGIVSNKCELNAYKALLKFDFDDVEKCNIESAYLYLYVKERECLNNIYGSNLIISKNIENFNVETVNWYKQPKTDMDDTLKMMVRADDEGRYMKIDIGEIIYKGILKNGEFGLTIQGVGRCKTSIVKFSSLETRTAPYIELKYKIPCYDSKPYCNDDYENEYECECDYEEDLEYQCLCDQEVGVNLEREEEIILEENLEKMDSVSRE